MAVPVVAVAAKWAAKKFAKKAAKKAAAKAASNSKVWYGGGVVVVLGGMLALSMILAIAGAVGGLLGALGGLAAGGAGVGLANECLTAESDPSGAALADIPPVAMEAYQNASKISGIDWVYIAAIGKVETDHGRYGGRHLDDRGQVQPTPIVNSIGASGPMQFMPATWAYYGRDGNFDKKKDVQNIFDAALGTGFYLKASGAPGDMRKAIFAYNHATWYVDKVMAQAAEYRAAAAVSDSGGSVSVGGGQAPPRQVGPNVVRLVQANIKVSMPDSSYAADLREVVSKAPDFITFNEVASRTNQQITPNGYSSFRGRGNTYAEEVAVAWRHDTWDVKDKGSVHASGETNLHWADRYLSWVTLEDKKGRVVSVISAHAMTNPYPDARRKVSARYTASMNSLVSQLAGQGMVLVGGDLNVHYPRDRQDRHPFTPFQGYKSSGLYSTFEMLGNHFATGDGGGTIDWILTQKGRGLKPLRHGAFGLNSDHNGVWADFEFNGEGGPATAAQVKATVAGQMAAASKNAADGDGTANGWTLPMRPGTYTLTARYGQPGPYWSSGYHTGTDFAAPEGTAVFAAAAGKVVPRPDQASWAGANFLTIDHGTIDGKSVFTWYAHLSQKLVDGGVVNGGSHIGAVGALGNVTGPHLHFEVRVNGQDVDPMTWLAGAGVPDITGIASDGCGPTGSSGIVGGNGAWGGYQNGQIPLSAMCKLTFYPTYLECNAAKALEALNDDYEKVFKTNVGPVGGYRSYAAQVQCQREKGSLCATPGTSNHGWGLAADLSGGGINNFGTRQHTWMRKNAEAFGWVLPDWARENGSKPEPWHWEFMGSGNSGNNRGPNVGGGLASPPTRNGSESFKIASWNVLGASHTEGPGCNKCGLPDSGPRMDRAVQVIRRHNLDVIGFQEFQPSQQRMFQSRMPGWALWGDKDNVVGWRTDQWRRVGQDTFRIPYFHGQSRLMPMVRLKHVRSGVEIVVISAHNPANARGPAQQWRDEAVRIEGDLTRALASSGTPVYLTGDMNDREKFFCPISGYGVLHASAGGSNVGGCSPPRNMNIDWVMGSKNSATFHDHTVDDGADVDFASDHPIIVARTTARN